MHKNSKIYIAGHLGLVGSAIMKRLQQDGYTNLVYRTRAELDLMDQTNVFEFFAEEKPEYVFLAAAKVGGIKANNMYRADFIYSNLQIQNNIIHASYINHVIKLLFLGSSCIYPALAPQPMSEECLLTGELEYTNEPYAIAKIAGIRMCESYNLQYGTNFLSVMPTNLYGLNDNFDLNTSHVLPAMVRKMYLARNLELGNYHKIASDLAIANDAQIIQDKLSEYGIVEQNSKVKLILWGSGVARREFLYVDDMADACLFVMNNVNFTDLMANPNQVRNTHINIGSGTDISIRELAHMIQEKTGFGGDIEFDSVNPDGTLQKSQDVSKLQNLGWKYSIELSAGVDRVVQHYAGLDSYNA